MNQHRPTGDPDHCDVCWDAYIDERLAEEDE